MKVKKLRKILKPYKDCEVFINKKGWANIYSLSDVDTHNHNVGHIYLVWEGDSDLWNRGCDYARSRLQCILSQYENSEHKTALNKLSAESTLIKDLKAEIDGLKDVYEKAETDTKEKLKEILYQYDKNDGSYNLNELLRDIRVLVTE